MPSGVCVLMPPRSAWSVVRDERAVVHVVGDAVVVAVGHARAGRPAVHRASTRASSDRGVLLEQEAVLDVLIGGLAHLARVVGVRG
jgi:hypothetical protein